MSKGRKKSTPHETIRLSGRNVYTDKRKRTIYYDRLTKQGYLIHKQNENRILFFQNRFVIILFAAILCAGTFLSWARPCTDRVPCRWQLPASLHRCAQRTPWPAGDR